MKMNKVTIDEQTIEALEDGKVSLNGEEFSSVYQIEPILNLLIKAVARLEEKK